jgi:hypothetical protein
MLIWKNVDLFVKNKIEMKIYVFIDIKTHMDIIYQLPLPDVVCDKIFGYACKSPHTGGLCVELLKKLIGSDVYERVVSNGGIVLDGDGHMAKIGEGLDDDWDILYTDDDALSAWIEERLELTFDIAQLDIGNISRLTEIDLHSTGVTGDIKHLKSLPNLAEIVLACTGVTGDIIHLKSLPNLTKMDLHHTDISGDITHLKSLSNLTNIRMSMCPTVTGDIKHLGSLPNLTVINLFNTGVFGDIIHLKSLLNLTTINLSVTGGVTGDISHLQSLPNLVEIGLDQTGVTGDIKHLGSLPNLTQIGLFQTGVTGDKKAFKASRKSNGLKEYHMYM